MCRVITKRQKSCLKCTRGEQPNKIVQNVTNHFPAQEKRSNTWTRSTGVRMKNSKSKTLQQKKCCKTVPKENVKDFDIECHKHAFNEAKKLKDD